MLLLAQELTGNNSGAARGTPENGCTAGKAPQRG